MAQSVIPVLAGVGVAGVGAGAGVAVSFFLRIIVYDTLSNCTIIPNSPFGCFFFLFFFCVI